MKDGPCTLTFVFENHITVRVHLDTQVSRARTEFHLEFETPDGPARLTYDEWAQFSQTLTVLPNPYALVEE